MFHSHPQALPFAGGCLKSSPKSPQTLGGSYATSHAVFWGLGGSATQGWSRPHPGECTPGWHPMTPDPRGPRARNNVKSQASQEPAKVPEGRLALLLFPLLFPALLRIVYFKYPLPPPPSWTCSGAAQQHPPLSPWGSSPTPHFPNFCPLTLVPAQVSCR